MRWFAGPLLALILWLAIAGPAADLAAARVALVIPDLLVFQPFRPSVSFTLPPTAETITYPVAGGDGQARLVLPRFARNSPAIVLVLGVYPAPLDDPRVVRLADGLARSGFAVLLPDSPRLRAGRIDPVEVDDLIGAFTTLRSRPEVDPKRVGFAGLSVGGGLVLVAAGDYRIAADVAFVHAIGGYADALDLLRAIGGHATIDPGRPAWEPGDVAILAYRRQLIDTLSDPADREILAAVYLSGDAAPLDQITAQGQRIRELLDGGDPATVDAMLDQLPSASLAVLRRLSPISVVDRIRGPVYLYHDRDDPFVPAGETRRLAGLLGSRAIYREYLLFAHVLPSAPSDPFVFLAEVAAFAGQLNAFYLAIG